MRACALTLLVMARDARAFVAVVHFVVAVQQGSCAPVLGFSSIRACGAMRLHAGRGVGWGGDVHARALDASGYRAACGVGQHAKARFKGSISHLEKPKVRILDYPTMGESDGASLRWMGDA